MSCKFAPLALALVLALSGATRADVKYKALIVDGQNNHGIWPKTSKTMQHRLEQTGLFTVDIARTPPAGENMSGFRLKFAKYDVVVSNYNGDPWPEATREAFVDYVREGGGVVIVHAANNAFVDWKEYNRIIGLGG